MLVRLSFIPAIEGGAAHLGQPEGAAHPHRGPGFGHPGQGQAGIVVLARAVLIRPWRAGSWNIRHQGRSARLSSSGWG